MYAYIQNISIKMPKVIGKQSIPATKREIALEHVVRMVFG